MTPTGCAAPPPVASVSIDRVHIAVGGYSSISFGDAKGDVYGFGIADLDEDGLLDIGRAYSARPRIVSRILGHDGANVAAEHG
jgi:hypothetical protein